MIILEAENITAGYTREVNILYDVGIRLKSGQIVSVIGPNGAGKSTLLKTIFGILKPTNGKISLKDEDITGLKPDKVANKGISYVPQVDNVFPSLTIQENLEMGAFIRNDDYSQRLNEIYELFPILGDRRKQKAGQLSGGQRQMVAMGRALMVDPQVLLLDEPSAGLSPKLVDMIFEKIRDINKTGVSMIIVEQNAREALKMANHGYVLAMGRNVLDDTGEALLANEEVEYHFYRCNRSITGWWHYPVCQFCPRRFNVNRRLYCTVHGHLGSRLDPRYELWAALVWLAHVDCLSGGDVCGRLCCHCPGSHLI
jgi:ABC-type branched-subunit amino acid transport system ATPase component